MANGITAALFLALEAQLPSLADQQAIVMRLPISRAASSALREKAAISRVKAEGAFVDALGLPKPIPYRGDRCSLVNLAR